MRCTVSSPVFATQASWTPSEMPCASLPIGIDAVCWSAGSLERRASSLLDASTTHSVPLPAAIWSGLSPTLTGSPTTASRSASISRSVPSLACETKMRLPSAVMPSGPSPTGIVLTTCACAGGVASAVTVGVTLALGGSGSSSPPNRPVAPAAATPAASRSRHGSATSRAMRRPRGQPAGPAGVRGGVSAGGGVTADGVRGAGVSAMRLGACAASPVATLPIGCGATSPCSAAQAARARSPAEA